MERWEGFEKISHDQECPLAVLSLEDCGYVTEESITAIIPPCSVLMAISYSSTTSWPSLNLWW